MKVILDIKDDKAEYILEILRNLKNVKIKPLKSNKEKFIEGFKEAIEEVKLARAGKIKLKSARELLDEL